MAPAFADIGSKGSMNNLPRQGEICLFARDLHHIRIAAQVDQLPLVTEQKMGGSVFFPSTEGNWHGPRERLTSSGKRIEERAKHLMDEEVSKLEFEKLKALVQQRRREALVERAEDLLLANTEEYRALKIGLMKSDWLMALKEQELWKERLKELERKREADNRQLREQHNTIALQCERHGMLRLHEATQELKRSRLQHLKEAGAERERERASLAEEARQLKARIEQENFKSVQEVQQKCAWQRQLHAEALGLLSRNTEEKMNNTAKRQAEVDAEALPVAKKAEKLRLLEAQMKEMRQRQIDFCSKLTAFQPADDEAREDTRLMKDAEQKERWGALDEKTVQQKEAEQQRQIADERVRQHQFKLDTQAKINREDAAFAEQWRKESEQALMAETLTNAQRRQASIKVANFQLQQMAELKEKKRRKRQLEKNDTKEALSDLVKVDELVGAFRLRCIQNALENGNPHWPLISTLSKYETSLGKRHFNNERERMFSDESGGECHGRS